MDCYIVTLIPIRKLIKMELNVVAFSVFAMSNTFKDFNEILVLLFLSNLMWSICGILMRI